MAVLVRAMLRVQGGDDCTLTHLEPVVTSQFDHANTQLALTAELHVFDKMLMQKSVPRQNGRTGRFNKQQHRIGHRCRNGLCLPASLPSHRPHRPQVVRHCTVQANRHRPSCALPGSFHRDARAPCIHFSGRVLHPHGGPAHASSSVSD
jgi:hypothetical protein